MSVLLFMPESGGNPLESVIMTSSDELSKSKTNSKEDVATTISQFELKNGRPNVRKLSNDSASMVLSIRSAEITEGDDFSSVGGGGGGGTVDENENDDEDDDSRASMSSTSLASAPSLRRRPLSRNTSAYSAATATSTRSAPPLHPSIADAKQPQLRLSPMGAIFGAAAPGGAHVVKAVNKAHERRAQRKLRCVDRPAVTVKRSASSPSSSSSLPQVHCGFLV